jgi:UDP-N-acetylglucosamine:LPS N-acetylglucosamine transferase
MAAANFYLGRSGAATAGELIAAGLPSLLMPDPQHSDRQQLANAQELVAVGLGRIIDQEDARGEDVLKWLESVWDAPRRPALDPPAGVIGEDILRVAVAS